MKRERNKIEPKWNKQNKTKHNATLKLETEFLILSFFFPSHLYMYMENSNTQWYS